MKFSLISVVAAYSILPKQHILNEQMHTVETGPDHREQMAESDILQLIRDDVPFIDVTTYEDVPFTHYQPEPIPSGVSKQEEVKALQKDIDITRMTEFLTKFSSFYTRYFKSSTGVDSANHLYGLVNASAQDFRCAKVTVNKFNHKNFPQFSIVAHVEGTDASLPPLILGSHQDSVNGRNPLKGRSPGADDDGSGTTSVLETFRVLSQSAECFKPRRSVEFHFYAAEEAGLLGSMDVAAHYKKNGANVHAMLQNDMTGYRKGTGSFGLIQDFVNQDLTNFLSTLIGAYTDMSITLTKCGYGCSDHASWHKNGYRSAFAIEGRFGSGMSPYIHSAKDSVDHINFEHVKEFVKLDLAFVVELSQ